MTEQAKSCGDCGLCCKLLAIQELGKGRGQWCAHAKQGRGCGIYPSRPQACRSFVCSWLVSPELGEEWKPSRSRMIVNRQAGGRLLTIEVDPAYPMAWRRPAHYAQIKRWSRAVLSGSCAVLVVVGARAFAIFPEQDIDLGLRDAGETYRFRYVRDGVRLTPMVDIRRPDGARRTVAGA